MGQDTLGIREQLEQKEKEYHGKDDILGLTLLTFPQYISATRSTMFTNHLKQFNNLIHPEFAKVCSGYENVFGKNSSSLVKARRDYEVYAKVEKFEDIPGYLYALFLYDRKHDYYDVLFKQVSEDLTEKYGYIYNDEDLDKLQPGDEIKKGDVLYKSSSYDEDNNYCYGINALTLHMIDPGNVEDAYVVSESFAKKMLSRKIDTVKVSINDNDFLLNYYGNSKEYRGIPEIGEEVRSHIVCAKRRIINDQILFDMKKSNMQKLDYLNDKIYYAKGIVTDIDIYCNKPLEELPDTDYNAQLIQHLKNQQRYYSELLQVCKEIKKSGSKYSADIGFIMARSKNILDPNYRWKDGENVFNNIVVELRVERDVGLFAGSKITGRYGDKGVISEIRPDSEMPYLEDGRVVDLISNPLGCPNRLNPYQWVEVELNHDADQVVKQCKKLKTNEERWEHFSSFMKNFNERGWYDQLKDYYESLETKEEIDEFWDSVFTDGCYINRPPMWEDVPSLYLLDELKKKFNIHRDDVYINKYGRKIKIMKSAIVGYKYCIKMKQDSEKNFSARSTGSLSQQGVPEKSNKLHNKEMLYSTTPVTLGRDENNNIAIGTNSFMLCKMHFFYRTSPKARKQIGKMYTMKNVLKLKKFKIHKDYLNRNVEILNAELKSMGARIDFGFDGITVDIKDDTLKTWSYKGILHLKTEEEMREFLLEELLRKNFNRLRLTGTKKELEKKYQEYKSYQISKAQGNLVVGFEDDGWG